VANASAASFITQTKATIGKLIALYLLNRNGQGVLNIQSLKRQ
jgi:hypothetical protein